MVLKQQLPNRTLNLKHCKPIIYIVKVSKRIWPQLFQKCFNEHIQCPNRSIWTRLYWHKIRNYAAYFKFLLKVRETKLKNAAHLIENLLSKTFNSQNSTDEWNKTFMPIKPMLLVQLESIVNEYSGDVGSFEAYWANGLQSCGSAIFFNSLQGWIAAIQLSYIFQISLP